MPLRLLFVLIFLLLTLAGPLSRVASAQQDELGLGMLSFRASAGYSGFGLPVANWSLGREWAGGGDLAWQLAYNNSNVPVLIELEHREAQAFYGRIEIIADNDYSEDSSGLQEPVLYSREIVAPPSVPQVFAFALRSAPQSEIGGYVRLKARLYRSNSPTPLLEQSASYRQLEPAWLYGLYLDDPRSGGSEGVYLDRINEANHLALEVRGAPHEYLSETRLYTLPLRRQQLTAAPLAARNFAFVFADAAALPGWPAEEQQALLQFMISGGYLCLFNASGSWQGIELGAEPRFIARGLLLPVAGDFGQARSMAQRWLEGELTELTLMGGGRAGGQSLDLRRSSEMLNADFELDTLLLSAEDGKPLSHQPQYLHPVWLYRESMRSGALEPWDSPEFSLSDGGGQARGANPQLRRALALSSAQPSLAALTARERRLPAGLFLLTLLLLAGFALQPGRRSLRLAQLALLGLTCLGGLWLLTRQEPQVSRPLRLELHDRELGLPGSSVRLLLAGVADREGDIEFLLEKDDMLRRVSWDAPGSWSLQEEDGAMLWRGSGGSSFLSLSADRLPKTALDAPVTIRQQYDDAGMLRIEIDASALPRAAMCSLLLPFGWTYFEGGSKAVVYTEQPQITVWPGAGRLRAWGELTRRWQIRNNSRDRSPSDEQNESLLRNLLGRRGQERGQSELARLGMAGISQNPSGYRSVLADQGLLFIELPGEHEDESSASFMRLSFQLEQRAKQGAGQ